MDLIKIWEPERAARMSPQVLAFVGDAVHSLVVRAELAASHDNKSGGLHKMAAGEVSAVAQAQHLDRIAPGLSERETEIYRRGRNTKVNNVAKNATHADYMKATGFEALLGYLYLTGQTERLLELIHG